MSKCPDCVAVQEAEQNPDTTCDMCSFDEIKWDSERQELETKVIEAVVELSDFMGCSQFTLDGIEIKVGPCVA